MNRPRLVILMALLAAATAMLAYQKLGPRRAAPQRSTLRAAAVRSPARARPSLETGRAASEKKVPPLVLAARSFLTEPLTALLAAGADPDAAAPDGTTPVFAAAETNASDALRLLLDAAATADATTPRGTALGVAARNGHVEAVRMLLGAGASPDGAIDSEPAVVAAARQGHLAIVQELVARPGLRTAAAQALEAAVRARHEDVVAVLLAAGAPLAEDAELRRETERLARLEAAGARPSLADLPRTPLAAEWDGPLLVGVRHAVLLGEECGFRPSPGDEELRASWTRVDLAKASLGRAGGDEILLLLVRGDAVPARLGAVSCEAGECGAAWYLAAVEPAPTSNDVLAAAPPGFVPPGARVQALTRADSRCAPPVPPVPGTKRTVRRCAAYRGDGALAIELLEDVETEPNEVGYQAANAHARLLRPDAPPGPWTDLGEGWDQDVLTPTLTITSPGAAARILFLRPGGLGDTVLRVGRVTATGALELGRSFAAGGQPCD